jgi:hypothetical protein
VALLLAGVLAACGGQASIASTHIGDDAGSSGAGGAPSTDASRSAGGAVLGSGGSGDPHFWSDGRAGIPSRLRDSGTACDFLHEVCGGLASYVSIEGDGAPLRLAYPKDPSCGTCTGTTCELWGRAHGSCGFIGVDLAVCAGPDGSPPCLDTSSVPESYIDRNGKTWSQVSLGGDSSQPGAITTEASVLLLDLDLTLTISDGASTRALPVHVHACGDIIKTLPPCH